MPIRIGVNRSIGQLLSGMSNVTSLDFGSEKNE